MLKILTMNINGYGEKHGGWEPRRSLIHALIAAHSPDVVVLQSVSQPAGAPDGADQAAELAGLLKSGYRGLYAPLSAPSGAERTGPALLTRLPVADHDTFPLTLQPGLEDVNRRLILYARFDLMGAPLHLFNAHFSWVQQQAEQNMEQAFGFIERFAPGRILLGDLNNPPDAPIFERLREAGWVDAWALLHPDKEGFTFEAGKWFTRIDYAWLDSNLAPRLRDVQVVGGEPGPGGGHASDHAGLLVSLDLPGVDES